MAPYPLFFYKSMRDSTAEDRCFAGTDSKASTPSVSSSKKKRVDETNVLILKDLLKKYGDDCQDMAKMARDKINVWQWTPRQLEKKMEAFRSNNVHVCHAKCNCGTPVMNAICGGKRKLVPNALLKRGYTRRTGLIPKQKFKPWNFF